MGLGGVYSAPTERLVPSGAMGKGDGWSARVKGEAAGEAMGQATAERSGAAVQLNLEAYTRGTMRFHPCATGIGSRARASLGVLLSVELLAVEGPSHGHRTSRAECHSGALLIRWGKQARLERL